MFFTDFLSLPRVEERYRLVTNFNKEQRHIYEKTVFATNEDLVIRDDAKDIYGNQVTYCNSLWINTRCNDLSAFWEVFDSIKKYYQ